MQETWVQSVGWKDPLEKGVATHSSILAWRIPWTEEPGGLQVHGVVNSWTWLSDSDTFLLLKRNFRDPDMWLVKIFLLRWRVSYCVWALLQPKKRHDAYWVALEVQIRSYQISRSVVSDSAIPWIAACQASLSITNSRSSLRLTSIESVMPSSHLILCIPLLLLPPIPPSIRVFSNESALHMRWPKYWSFSFSISPSKEHRGLISFRMDWLDLLAVQGTLKSLLQHHSSKASVLQCSALFIIQLSHPYMTTGKTIALTR